MELHHSKHHNTYVQGANAALENLSKARDEGDFSKINQFSKDLAFNVGGHTNHTVFWKNLSPTGGGEPEGELLEAIKDAFGSFDKFKAHSPSGQDSGLQLGGSFHVNRGQVDHLPALRPAVERSCRHGSGVCSACGARFTLTSQRQE